jgi:integrase
MAVYKRGGVYWFSFVYAGKRVQKSAKTTSKTVAREAEKNYRDRLERILAGIPAEKSQDRIRSIAEIVRGYLEHFDINHRERTVAINKSCLNHVTRLLGGTLLSDLDEHQIRKYIRTRLDEGVCGRTINIELGALSRAIGQPWSRLWPKVRKLEERKDVGRALSAEEEVKLITMAPEVRRSPLIGLFVRVALLTGMRAGEITGLRWGQVDFAKRVISVGRAKTSSGTGRQIPMNGELHELLTAHAKWFTQYFGEAHETFCLFPWGSPLPSDPKRPTTTIKKAWGNLRKKANVDCRIHDLRHTVATKLAEAGTPESTMQALLGHMSRAMLERYSHIRLAAKRVAVEALTARPSERISQPDATNSTAVGESAFIQ